MGFSDLWKTEIHQTGPWSVIDAIWITIIRLQVILIIVWLIITIIAVVFYVLGIGGSEYNKY